MTAKRQSRDENINGNKTFRSDYFKSSDIGMVPSFSSHLNQPMPLGKFTENELIRRANYWGKGVPERNNLFCNERRTANRKSDKVSSASSSSVSSRRPAQGVDRGRFRKKCLSETYDTSDFGGNGLKPYGRVLDHEKNRLAEKYCTKSTAASSVLPFSSLKPRNNLKQHESKPMVKGNGNSSTDCKSTLARDVWQVGNSSSTFDGTIDVSGHDQTKCRSRSSSSRPSRARRRRRKSTSRSGSPKNISHSAKMCFCTLCVAPRSASCPKPKARMKSPPWRNSMSSNKCGPTQKWCGKPISGPGGEKREMVVCLDPCSWSDPQIAILKTFLKTSKVHEVIKLLCLVRNLIRDRYSTLCSNSGRETTEKDGKCPTCKRLCESCGDKPSGRVSRRSSSPCRRGNNKTHECTSYSCKKDETSSRGCKNNDMSVYICKSGHGRKTPVGNGTSSCDYRTKHKKRSTSRTRRSRNQECQKQTGGDNREKNKWTINIPNAEDCTTEDEETKPQANTRKSNYRSQSLDRKRRKKLDIPPFENAFVEGKGIPPPGKEGQSWTKVINDCQKFLRATQEKRCQGKHQLESKLIDARYSHLDTQNNNDKVITKESPGLPNEGTFDGHEPSSDDSCPKHYSPSNYSRPSSRSQCKPSDPFTFILPSSDGVLGKQSCEQQEDFSDSGTVHTWNDGTQQQSGDEMNTDCWKTSAQNTVNRNGNWEDEVTGHETDNRDINSRALFDINKSTQMLLNKASDRIKQVGNYFDRNEIKAHDGRSTDYNSNLTESENDFFRSKETTPRNNHHHDFAPLSYKTCNMTSGVSSVNANQSRSIAITDQCPNNSSFEISVRSRNHVRTNDSQPKNNSKRRTNDRDGYVHDVTSCASLTSLDTTLSNCNLSAMKRNYENLLKEKNKPRGDVDKHEGSYDGDNELVTPTGSTVNTFIDERCARLNKESSTTNASPVVVKCYTHASPFPKQSHSE